MGKVGENSQHSRPLEKPFLKSSLQPLTPFTCTNPGCKAEGCCWVVSEADGCSSLHKPSQMLPRNGEAVGYYF